jgi:hypothetical protein
MERHSIVGQTKDGKCWNAISKKIGKFSNETVTELWSESLELSNEWPLL